jgi:hypothetical protein
MDDFAFAFAFAAHFTSFLFSDQNSMTELLHGIR